MNEEQEKLFLLGKAFAKEVQEGLQQGKSYNEMTACSPEHAQEILKIHRNHNSEQAYYWQGYLAGWE